MITAKFKKKNDQIYWYQVTGHAGFANVGNDIVCAGVSALYISVTNALLGYGRTFERNEGYFILEPTDKELASLQILHDGIISIAEQYPANVVIVEE